MKLKDYVTLGNLLSGLLSIVALFHHRFDLASYLVLAGFVFDVLDGLVARLTHQFNKFGSELDNLCDMVSYSVAPGFLLFYAYYYQAGFPLWVAAAVGFLPVCVGTVRAARFNVRRAEFPGFFIGLPRTAFALFMVSLLNSSVFQDLGRLVSWLYAVPTVLVAIISYLMISTHPFVSHHSRKFRGMLRFGMWFFLVSLPVGLVGGWLLLDDPMLVFDFLLFDQLIYLLLSNTVVPPEEMKAAKAYVREWLAME
ncbi:MAG: hypothetical protein FJ109_15340 [Deltaproteobacteria bacterium]|nr:hypothetical protein [Deltaproteobacteria bacterium]